MNEKERDTAGGDVPLIFDYEENLTDEEEAILLMATTAVVKSIVKREKNRTKRSLLIRRISDYTNYSAIRGAALLQAAIKEAMSNRESMQKFIEEFDEWVEDAFEKFDRSGEIFKEK